MSVGWSTQRWRCSSLSAAAWATCWSFLRSGRLKPSSSPPCAWSSPWLWPTFWWAAWPYRWPWWWTAEPRLLSRAACFSAAWSSPWPSSQFCVWWLSHWIASFVSAPLSGRSFFVRTLNYMNLSEFVEMNRKCSFAWPCKITLSHTSMYLWPFVVRRATLLCLPKIIIALFLLGTKGPLYQHIRGSWWQHVGFWPYLWVLPPCLGGTTSAPQTTHPTKPKSASSSGWSPCRTWFTSTFYSARCCPSLLWRQYTATFSAPFEQTFAKSPATLHKTGRRTTWRRRSSWRDLSPWSWHCLPSRGSLSTWWTASITWRQKLYRYKPSTSAFCFLTQTPPSTQLCMRLKYPRSRKRTWRSGDSTFHVHSLCRSDSALFLH